MSETYAKEPKTRFRRLNQDDHRSIFWQLDSDSRDWLANTFETFESTLPEDLKHSERLQLYQNLNDFCHYVPFNDIIKVHVDPDHADIDDIIDAYETELDFIYKQYASILEWATQPWSKANQINAADALLCGIDDDPANRRALYESAHGLAMFGQRHELPQDDILFMLEMTHNTRALHELLDYQSRKAAAIGEFYQCMMPSPEDQSLI